MLKTAPLAEVYWQLLVIYVKGNANNTISNYTDCLEYTGSSHTCNINLKPSHNPIYIV